MTCVDQPISWLRLERYALAELDQGTTAVVRRHLDDCAACRAALASLEVDVPSLPPLPAPRARMIAATPTPWWRRWTLGAGLGAALAAAVLLLWLRTPTASPPGRSARIKGAGLVSLTLVRERAGVIAFDPGDVADDDRWKAQLTCALGGTVWTDVVVYQPSGASFPLAPQAIACGNQVAVPGAFRITDGDATICVALGAAPPDRAKLARGPRNPAVCAAVKRR
jgi:Putative zinc-finger